MKQTNVRKLFSTGSGYAQGITIPKFIYEQLGWESGDKVVLKVNGDKLMVEKDKEEKTQEDFEADAEKADDLRQDEHGKDTKETTRVPEVGGLSN